MGNRSIVETESRLNSNVKVIDGSKASNGKVNTKIAFSMPKNGTITIKTNPNENTTIKMRVRRRTKIRVTKA